MKNSYLLIVIFIALLASVNLKAETISIGENQPCYNQYFDCQYLGPYLMPIPSDFDPDCILLVEYYKRVCGNTVFDIQIVGIYYGPQTWGGPPDTVCMQNISLSSSDTWKLAFVKVYEHEIKNVNQILKTHHFTTQRQCSKWVWAGGASPMNPQSFVGVSPDTLVITTANLVDPWGLLDWLDPDNHTIITTPILGKLVWCESACCCYELQRNYQDGELLALWAETPCLNDDNPCPPGCTGSCEDMAFVWIKDGGLIGKININFNNPIHSESSIMPNPNDGTFDIKLSNAETGILKIVVFDVQGNELLNANANKNSDEILAPIKLHLSSGSYFLYLSMDDRFVGLEKFIVNK